MGLGIAAVTLGGEQLVAAIVLPAGSGTAGILHAFWATVAVSAFLLATSVLVLAFIVLRPIRALTRATQAVANDDLDVMVPVTSTDELAELTTSFNKMVEGLRERAALREDLRASRERIVAAADASRREVERDLHDGAQQHLVMVRLKLGLLAKDVEGDDRLAARVGALRQDLDKALDELRRLARGLYPPQLEEAGLAAALHEAAAMSAIPTRVEPDGVGRYGRELEAAVYFCCIEAMQNAAKHAGDGASVTVRLGEHDGLLEFEVSDDGRGYDVAAVTAGSGVQNIVDRVGALGGVVAMRTAPGAGTTVKAAIPVRAEHPVVAG
jgi:signal transduction histidine kinase